MTTLKIEDYLHLYLGCECKLSEGPTTIKTEITGICIDNVKKNAWKCLPILRPLSDMTDAEANASDIAGGSESFLEIWEKGQAITPKTMLFLLTRGFDLFGLIEAGLALDKTVFPHLSKEENNK